VSQITVIPPYVPQTPVKPASPAADGTPSFADVLDTVTDPVEEPAPPAEDIDTAAPGAEPVPEVVDPITEVENTESADALTAVMDGLLQLQKALQNGETPDPELVGKINDAIDKLAGALGLTLTDMPTADELAAMAARQPVEGEPIQTQLQKLLAPVAQSLTATAGQPDLTALGDKLGAMLKALTDADPEQIKALQPNIEQAVAQASKPATPVPTITAPAPAPTIAAVEMKLAAPDLSVEGTVATKTVKPEPVEEPRPAPTPAASATQASATTAKERPAKGARPEPAPAVVTATAHDNPEVPAAPSSPAQAKADAAAAAAAVAPRPVVPGYQTSQQQINLPQIAFELARQVTDGNSRFQIRLDPAELGRIDVKLDIDKSGQVTARLVVEKSETLDLMQRDQRGLEKALQQAGLDGAKTNLEFSLKQNAFSQGQAGEGRQGRPAAFGEGQGTGETDEGPLPTVNLYRGNLSASGVNILA
jgi:flagellar hook-length control protein FliK